MSCKSKIAKAARIRSSPSRSPRTFYPRCPCDLLDGGGHSTSIPNSRSAVIVLAPLSMLKVTRRSFLRSMEELSVVLSRTILGRNVFGVVDSRGINIWVIVSAIGDHE